MAGCVGVATGRVDLLAFVLGSGIAGGGFDKNQKPSKLTGLLGF
ncbi:MAG TPA: hypothetical protein VE057_25395 [Archangium sp.]|jgi:hypothetical protein|nr:hypothetical protein [Archangium sp.]